MADNKPKSSFLTTTFENIANLNAAKVEEEQKNSNMSLLSRVK